MNLCVLKVSKMKAVHRVGRKLVSHTENVYVSYKLGERSFVQIVFSMYGTCTQDLE